MLSPPCSASAKLKSFTLTAFLPFFSNPLFLSKRRYSLGFFLIFSCSPSFKLKRQGIPPILSMKGSSMEKILTVYDEDELYCKRLSLYLRQNTKLPFQIYPVCNPEKLEQFLKKKEADLLLLSEKNAKSLHFSPKSKRTLYLTEENILSKKKKNNAIYKYQSADRIMREILLQYGELALLENNGQGKAEIFMIYSPLGRSGKTALAYEIADILGKNRKTLFLSLSESGSAAKQFEGLVGFHALKANETKERECLTEALYHFKENTLSPMILKALSYDRKTYSTILPVRSPEDMQSISPRELAVFLDKLSEESGVAALVLDTDCSLSKYLDCFTQCKKIFMPVLPDPISQKKLAFFQSYLKKNLSEEVLEKFVQCEIPAPQESSNTMQISGDRAKYFHPSTLKDYTESLLIRHIYEEESREKEQYRKMLI